MNIVFASSPARSSLWVALIGMSIAGLLAAGCAPRPNPSVNTDPYGWDDPVKRPPQAEAPEDGVDESQEDVYALESEGSVPPPADIDFEEDSLPPAPEDVDAAPLGRESVQSSSLDQEDLPDVSAAPIPPSVTAPVDPTVELPIGQSEPSMVLGYRVQVHASTERAVAERVGREARARVAEPVYVSFESPYYKVRVGDFNDRALALRLRDRLRSYGYPEAWVVNTPVDARKLDSGP